MKIALILWNGTVGGAERVTITLARQWSVMAVEPTIVFVGGAEPLGSGLAGTGIAHEALELSKGSEVLLHPRRFARTVGAAGPDGALVADCGYLSAALRLGGYRAPIVGVEHGRLLEVTGMPRARRAAHLAFRAVGAAARDADVAVSDFMAAEHAAHAHARPLTRIFNFVDLAMYGAVSARERRNGEPLKVGCAARLVPGKGIDQVIRAVAIAQAQGYDLRLAVAGDGPDRIRLERLAAGLSVSTSIEFRGLVTDMPAFWRECHVAVAASDTIAESFSLVALEAMACARPVVVTRNGGMPEVPVDGITGRIVAPGDADDLAAALVAYADDAGAVVAHGRAARTRAVTRFDAQTLAHAYLEVFRGTRKLVQSGA